MAGFEHLGRFLIAAGLTLASIGVLITFAPRIPGVRELGRLPGDLVVERGSFTLFIPIVSSIIISVILTILVNLIIRR
jgi:hypothetical protein